MFYIFEKKMNPFIIKGYAGPEFCETRTYPLEFLYI